jgi:hypothetical protein
MERPILRLRNRTVSLLAGLLFGAIVIALDLVTPPQVMLSIFFVLPVLVVAWYNGLAWGLVLSVALVLSRFLIATVVEPMWPVSYDVINAANRLVVLSVVSVLASRLADAVRHVTTLEGLIPVCANCKKIRNQEKEWEPLEKYLSERSGAAFTHGICPDCATLLYGDILPRT